MESNSRQAVEKYGLELLSSELSVDAWRLQAVVIVTFPTCSDNSWTGRCEMRPEYRGAT